MLIVSFFTVMSHTFLSPFNIHYSNRWVWGTFSWNLCANVEVVLHRQTVTQKYHRNQKWLLRQGTLLIVEKPLKCMNVLLAAGAFPLKQVLDETDTAKQQLP